MAMKTVIHVNRHHIASNFKDDGDRHVFSVKDYKQTRTGNHVTVEGKVSFVYRPQKPLACGARAWVETWNKVEVE
jgi:hypothetical protein